MARSGLEPEADPARDDRQLVRRYDHRMLVARALNFGECMLDRRIDLRVAAGVVELYRHHLASGRDVEAPGRRVRPRGSRGREPGGVHLCCKVDPVARVRRTERWRWLVVVCMLELRREIDRIVDTRVIGACTTSARRSRTEEHTSELQSRGL